MPVTQKIRSQVPLGLPDTDVRGVRMMASTQADLSGLRCCVGPDRVLQGSPRWSTISPCCNDPTRSVALSFTHDVLTGRFSPPFAHNVFQIRQS